MIKNGVGATAVMFDDAKRAVTNLMARENITVQVVAGAPTAYFNPKTRVLTVPEWDALTADQTDLLMSHEVGHALFTPRDAFDTVLANASAGLLTYVNIVEDARIERKMKNAFPGLARVFYKGYQQFHTDGPILKGTKSSLFNPQTGAEFPVANMKLIDRINLYYKIGAFVTVPFTASEAQWIAKIDRAGSFEQAVEIAKALHKLAKDDAKEQKQQNPSQDQKQSDKSDKSDKSEQTPNQEPSQDADESDDESESQDADDSQDSQDANESDDSQDSQDGNEDESEDAAESQDSQDADESEGDAKTAESSDDPSADTTTDEILKSLAKGRPDDLRETTVQLVIGQVPEDIATKRTLSAAQWAEESVTKMKAYDVNVDASLSTLETTWNAKHASTVANMAMEFERRKNAKAMQNAKVAKTGRINLNKLHAYKFTDDLFLRSCTMPNGKNHGVVMLIDGSGSMASVFANTLDQVLLFAQFAKKVAIPFEAYMFTNVVDDRTSMHEQRHVEGINRINLSNDGTLVGLINTTASGENFKKQVRTVLAMQYLYASAVDRDEQGVTFEARYAFSQIPYHNLGSTPLWTGMMLVDRVIERMKSVNRLDKMTLVVVSDGDDTSNLNFQTPNTHGGTTTAVLSTRQPFMVRDTVTKKLFVGSAMENSRYYGSRLVQPQNAVMAMLFGVLKARYDVRGIYLFIHSSYGYNSRRRNYTSYTVPAGVEAMVKPGVTTMTDATKIHEALKADGQYALPSDLGLTDLCLLVKSTSLDLNEDTFTSLDTTNMTAKKIAAQFTKSMVKGVANRKFVGAVMPFIQ